MMFETATDARTRAAMTAAHAERGAALRHLMRAIFRRA